MNIMIVEDDKVLSLLLSKMVERLGHSILSIETTGRNALQKIRDMHPDLILMDIMLEDDLDGIDVMKTLRDESNVTPVIYITGNSDPVNLDRASDTDYEHYLIKPISFDELQEALQSNIAS